MEFIHLIHNLIIHRYFYTVHGILTHYIFIYKLCYVSLFLFSHTIPLILSTLIFCFPFTFLGGVSVSIFSSQLCDASCGCCSSIICTLAAEGNSSHSESEEISPLWKLAWGLFRRMEITIYLSIYRSDALLPPAEEPPPLPIQILPSCLIQPSPLW